MTVTALSQSTGINRTSLSKWLAGKRPLSTLKMALVMTALGITVTEDLDVTSHLDRRRGPPPAVGPAG